MHDSHGSGLTTATDTPAFGVARSFSGRRWRLRAVDEDAAAALVREEQVSPALARLLAARGIPANAVRGYLIERGVSPEQVVARGYGAEDPVDTNATAVGRSRNRRVELHRIN